MTLKLTMLMFTLGFLLTNSFTIVKHEISDELSGPRCLDGSPAAMYIDLKQNTDKFIIYFQGGGLCRGDGLNGMLDYCLKRSTTNLGSSVNYPDVTNFNGHPFLSPDQSVNPNFYNWNRVFVPYCDGSLHVGFKSNPVEYKGSKLYFRGQNNTQAHFDYLAKYFKFYNASQIVVSGTSAGAMATYMWGNYVYNKAINQQNVVLMPDSGIFLTDFVNPWTNKTMEYYTSSLLQIAFQQTQIPLTECIDKYGQERILECFKAGNLYDILKPRTLVIQSKYDAWGLQQILGLQCLTHPFPSSIEGCNDQQRAYIQKYHITLQQNILSYTREQRHGIWAIGCVQHGFVQDVKSFSSQSYVSPFPAGSTLNEAVSRFMKGQKVDFIDDSVWPSNKGCSGLKSFKNLRIANQYSN